MAHLDTASEGHVLVGARVGKGILTNARSPTDERLVGQWTVDTFAGLRVLRVCVRQAVAGRPIEHGGPHEEIARRLAIVATELAANAMAHTGPPTTVRLFQTATTHILEVADNDPWLVPRFTEERFPGPAGSACRWLANCPSTWAGSPMPEPSTYGPRSTSRGRCRDVYRLRHHGQGLPGRLLAQVASARGSGPGVPRDGHHGAGTRAVGWFGDEVPGPEGPFGTDGRWGAAFYWR
jgi:hypothetical protein